MTRERPKDTVKVHRNLDPALHPFERQLRAHHAIYINIVECDRTFTLLSRCTQFMAELASTRER